MSKIDVYDFMTFIEKSLFSLIVLALATMSIAQILLTDETWRNYLNFANRLESQKIFISDWPQVESAAGTDLKNVGWITLKLEKYHTLPNAYILVNGREVRRFTTDTVIVPVREGDIVEADGSSYSKSFAINVAAVTDNIDTEIQNSTLTVSHDVITITEVKLK